MRVNLRQSARSAANIALSNPVDANARPLSGMLEDFDLQSAQLLPQLTISTMVMHVIEEREAEHESGK